MSDNEKAREAREKLQKMHQLLEDNHDLLSRLATTDAEREALKVFDKRGRAAQTGQGKKKKRWWQFWK